VNSWLPAGGVRIRIARRGCSKRYRVVKRLQECPFPRKTREGWEMRSDLRAEVDEIQGPMKGGESWAYQISKVDV
jgi:hypothetical protein